jgi:hypothetical protein
MKRLVLSICIFVLFFFIASPGSTLTPQPAKGQKIEKFTGRVAAVNLQESTLAVQSTKSGMTFDVKSAKLKGYDAIGNIKEGDRVTVHYVMHEGRATARTLTKNKSYR